MQDSEYKDIVTVACPPFVMLVNVNRSLRYMQLSYTLYIHELSKKNGAAYDNALELMRFQKTHIRSIFIMDESVDYFAELYGPIIKLPYHNDINVCFYICK